MFEAGGGGGAIFKSHLASLLSIEVPSFTSI